MPDFEYAKGRISESIQFISKEMKEFDREYSNKTWKEYQGDDKLQKLMDRTVENILTAFIEMAGTILTEEGIAVESYSDTLAKIGKLFGFTSGEQKKLSELAFHRNRLAHRYLDFRWGAIKGYVKQRALVKRILELALQREKRKITG